eukprot:CAMPEP_0203776622 /NCGR_PEP_ID=MMETSP0099_2-20121227/6854_1 /ASSEMBLY_ACC=CAM_ASM_000209 /TAXON_ID=96639 /ORGANISM=" , Strain NY0313808BC1" /LENGTH=511 /DNA_ID=CAMNT_0050675661 /DNA_START=55 /DNA_END=1586 /DNA_ORIENTATION=-
MSGLFSFMKKATVPIAEPVQAGEGVSLSLSAKALFPAYQYNQGVETTLMATIQGLDMSKSDSERKGLDMVVVLDKSGSMSGEKLALCRDTCEFLTKELGENDRFGLITYDTNVEESLQLTRMDTKGKSKAQNIISKVRAGSSTNLSGGLLRGISMLGDSVESEGENTPVANIVHNSSKESTQKAVVVGDRIRTVLLLTDGYANYGVTDPKKLSTLTQQAIAKIPGGCRLFTFGYGANHCSSLLEKLANCGDGSYFFVQHTEDIVTAFADCLGGLISVVAQNIQMTITAAGGTKLIGDPLTNYKCSSTSKTRTIQFPDIYAGESRNILCNIVLPVLTSPVENAEDAPLAMIKVTFADACSGNLCELEYVLTVARPEHISEKDHAASVDAEVDTHRLRFETAKEIERARKIADEGKYQQGQDILRKMRATCDAYRGSSNRSSKDERTLEGLVEDLEECEEYMDGARWGEGTKICQNMTTEHGCERSIRTKGAYQTTTQQNMRAKGKKFMAFKG